MSYFELCESASSARHGNGSERAHGSTEPTPTSVVSDYNAMQVATSDTPDSYTFDINSDDSSDYIMDFTVGDDGDQLDLSDLLIDYTSGDDLSEYIEVLGGDVDGGDVTLNIDKDGGGDDFGSPSLTITLADIGSSTDPVTLTLLENHNIII